MNKVKCLFGYHKFDIPYDSPRLRGHLTRLYLCSICRRAVQEDLLHGGDTIWQLDENEQPISWQSIKQRMDNVWINGEWGDVWSKSIK